MKKNYTFKDSILLPLKYSPFVAILLALFGICQGFILPFQTFAVAEFIDVVTKFTAKELGFQKVALWITVLIVLTAITWLLKCFRNLMAAKLELNLRKNFRLQITEKRSKLEYFYIEDAPTWDLISRISEKPETRLRDAYVNFLDFAALIIQIMGLVMLFITQVWQIAIVMLVIVIPLIVLAVKSGKENYNVKMETQKYHRRHEYIREVLMNREASQERAIFGYGNGLSNVWHEYYENARKIELKTRAKWYIRSKSNGIITTVVAIIVSLFLITPALDRVITTGMFISLINATYSLVSTLTWSLVVYIEQIANNMEYMKEFDKFSKLHEVKVNDNKTAADEISFESIEFRRVNFKYPGTDNYILNNFSFKFEQGLNYALVGSNGAGKTTLIKIMMGLYDNYEGSILLNGVDVEDYDSEVRKKLFSAVFQDYAKYSLTIGDNIKIGNLAEYDTIKSQELEDVIKSVGFNMSQYKSGAETKLGKIYEDGLDISGGQWQRIALARAMIHNAELCVLDEPTSALDPISESNLYHEFSNMSKGRTVILISHRLGSTKIADRILVLDKGRLSEEGTHQQLMDMDGIYATMYKSQRSWYGEN